MNVKVVYYSQSGNTEAIANEIASELAVPAYTIDEMPAAALDCDVLFLGGAPYLNALAKELREYANAIPAGKVGRVVLFTTSGVSRRTILALRKILLRKGILVDCKHFFAPEFAIESRKQAARAFAHKHVKEANSICCGTDVKAVAITAISIAVATAAVAGVTVAAVCGARRFKKR